MQKAVEENNEVIENGEGSVFPVEDAEKSNLVKIVKSYVSETQQRLREMPQVKVDEKDD
jgi:hypothetical protein